jgi:ABC-2 type transport system ATP-binding protein
VRVAEEAQREEAEVLLKQLVGEVHDGDDPASLAAKVSRDEQVPQALAALAARGVTVTEFALAQPSLDDVFFALTGHAAEEKENKETA